jgi:hypothetical protein
VLEHQKTLKTERQGDRDTEKDKYRYRQIDGDTEKDKSRYRQIDGDTDTQRHNEKTQTF